MAERACAAKDWDGCAIADACRIEGRNDAPAAMERLRNGCDRGMPTACFYWADAQERPDAARPAIAPEELQRACELACGGRRPVGPLGCTRFARLRLAGVVDAAQAEHLTAILQRGCDQSIAEACCALAQVYATGRGRDADAGKAAELRSKACTLGAQPCCHP
jgi:TPR repeat protein